MAGAMAMASSARACASSPSPSPSSSSSSSSPLPIPTRVRLPNQNPNHPLSMESTLHDPSLQFANMMWFKGPYNTQIFVGENEPPDSVVRRFKRAVMQAGVIAECRRRRFFETPQEVAKRKLQAAQRRRSRARFSRVPSEPKRDGKKAAATEDNDDDDNWEYDGIDGPM